MGFKKKKKKLKNRYAKTYFGIYVVQKLKK